MDGLQQISLTAASRGLVAETYDHVQQQEASDEAVFVELSGVLLGEFGAVLKHPL